VPSFRAAPCRTCHAPPSAIFYFCPGNTDAWLIFFNHGRAASRAVYRGFPTREIHRGRSLFLLAQRTNEQANERTRFRLCAPSRYHPPSARVTTTPRFQLDPFLRSWFFPRDFLHAVNNAYTITFAKLKIKEALAPDLALTYEFLFRVEG